MTVKPDFGNAARFIVWDKFTNTITVPTNATNDRDIGLYPMSIMLMDDKVTSIAFSSQTYYGNVTYHFTLMINRKADYVAPLQRPPDVRLETIFMKYNTSVIDVREFDKNYIFNATDTTLIKQAAPQFADPNLKVVQIPKDESKLGMTNFTTPELPRIVMTQKGTIQTNRQNAAIDQLFFEEDKSFVEVVQPKPYVKSMDESGVITVGFGTKMKVPENL